MAYIDANGQNYYQALYDALYSTPKTLVSISATYNQTDTIYTTDSLNDIPSRGTLTVIATYDDSSTETITNYTLSGNLTAGTSTITVIYSGKTTTINVNVTAVVGTYTIINNLTGCSTSNNATTIIENNSYNAAITASSGYTLTGATASVTMGGNTVTGAYSNGTISIANVTGDIVITVTAAARTVSSISAVFNQGSNVVYTTDSLNSLKQYLTVTATYSDSGSETVNDYTLSGTLEEGTSTITVTYSGQTDTFSVNVTSYDTKAVIQTENVVWSNTAPNTKAATGFGVTQWYPYEFTQEQLENCHYWDSTNNYMTVEGWAEIRICAPDYLSYQAGHSWPSSNNFKHVIGKDGTYTNSRSITRNIVNRFLFGRYTLSAVAANGFSASIPLDDIDYAYAYWHKGQTYSIVPNGVNAGDIIFAGKYTPYHNLTNISEAPTLEEITATFAQDGAVITPESTLVSLKPMLSIIAEYSDGTELPVNLGLVTLEGTLAEGVSTITATYNGKQSTFDVLVTASGE